MKSERSLVEKRKIEFVAKLACVFYFYAWTAIDFSD